MWKFPSQGSNPCLCSDLSCCTWLLNPVCHSRNSIKSSFSFHLITEKRSNYDPVSRIVQMGSILCSRSLYFGIWLVVPSILLAGALPGPPASLVSSCHVPHLEGWSLPRAAAGRGAVRLESDRWGLRPTWPLTSSLTVVKGLSKPQFLLCIQWV